MQYRELHSWHVSATEAQRIQQRLRRHIQVGTYVRDIRYIAGADIAVAHTTPMCTLASSFWTTLHLPLSSVRA